MCRAANIVRLQLHKLSDRLADRDIQLRLTDAAAQFILTQVRLCVAVEWRLLLFV